MAAKTAQAVAPSMISAINLNIYALVKHPVHMMPYGVAEKIEYILREQVIKNLPDELKLLGINVDVPEVLVFGGDK